MDEINMNNLCENCDAKNRLGKCGGRDGTFKYCFRRCGSTDGLESTIIPFNDIADLYNHDYFNNDVFGIIKGSLRMGNYCDSTKLLLGKYIKEESDKEYPIGYVTCDC